MKKRLRFPAVFFLLMILLAACVSPLPSDGTQPSSSNDVATAAAMTLQALEAGSGSTPASAASVDLLPHRLYFLAPDGQAISQVFRLERDGTTRTQLTSEPTNVWDYDVSLADESLVYEVNGQLVLVNADGSNRRVLAEVNSNPENHGFYHPVFSPDGKTLAYAHGGLNLYDLPSGTSKLVIADQMQDNGSGQMLLVEDYVPERYSPDGTKLLLALGHWEVAPSHAVYTPGTNTLVKAMGVENDIYCCTFYGGPSWSPDSASFYGVASTYDFAYKSGELWRVDAVSGMVTRMLMNAGDGTASLPEKPYLAPNGQLYYFFGTYRMDSGFFDAPLIQLVRSSPDGVTNRTVLRAENFRMMNQALWAPDASFVIVATAPDRFATQDGGVLELYPTNGQKSPVWLAPFGNQMKWGP